MAFTTFLAQQAAARYRSAGRMTWKWAEGKLRGDPVFMGILQNRLIRDGERVLDLGCGQGLLAAWLLNASEQYAAGKWEDPRGSAPFTPPYKLELRGIELLPRDVELAQHALGGQADIRQGNICHEDFGQADVIVLLDVLHYIDYAAQEDVLRRACAALRPGGRLLLRVGDANAGRGFRWSNWVDKLVVFARYRSWSRLWCRSIPEWTALLESQGFKVRPLPMSEGTAFANVLLIGAKQS
ncbi:class I SAM-dependent methyltransferase [Uliginosibacterium sp. H3]|uniref:Class I SAM-dependent methyltransferase n=1 Tax=Uliginosibacterium silvisoli TaxID=3114758 RepID=A0ABU6K6B6_9RHOO|nr:class I SAM-dependent methyltransferase [Uliginosibacterium sp. H3]